MRAHRCRGDRRLSRVRFVASLLVAATDLTAATAPVPPAALFPSAFLAERRVSELGPGDRVEHRTPTVTEYYGGSTLVAVRAGEDRTVIDFARREITEVSVSRGTYWVLGFARMRELRERLARADAATGGASSGSSAVPAKAATRPRIAVEEVRESARSSTLAPGLRHLRATAEGSAAHLEAWVDGRVRLGVAARAALEGLETEAFGAVVSSREPAPADLLAAARRAADGAFPVRTRRTVVDRDGRETGLVVEDEVTRLETIPDVPRKLLVVPEGLRRVPSPLEAMVAVAEEDAAVRGGGR